MAKEIIVSSFVFYNYIIVTSHTGPLTLIIYYMHYD